MTAPSFVTAPLETGDRLTRDEFHRRYLARPDIKRAELINGVVHLPSPTRWTQHDGAAALVITWLGAYAARHPEARVGGSATLLLDGDNEVQPDAFLFRWDPGGPGAHPNAEGYIEGAPQLVVEVAASRASYDLHAKKEVYLRNGVQEYVVWRTLDGMIDWFRFEDGDYVWVEPNEEGIVESAVFPGLRLDVARMLRGDLAAVLAVLEWA